MSDARSNKF